MNLDGAIALNAGKTGSFNKRSVGRVVDAHQTERAIVFSLDELKQFQMRQQFLVAELPDLRMLIGDARDREALSLPSSVGLGRAELERVTDALARCRSVDRW